MIDHKIFTFGNIFLLNVNFENKIQISSQLSNNSLNLK
jgi:hypothetical protein